MSRVATGIVVIIAISLIIVFFATQNTQYVKSSVDTFGGCFASGDCISIIKQPVILPPSIQKLLQTSNSTEINSSNLPSAFTKLADQQKTNQSTTSITSTNNSEISGGLYKGTISSNAQIVATQLETGVPVHHTGETVFVAGQITTKQLPQALTITVTCCGMDYYIQVPHYPTDGQGNFAFPINTSGSFPLGLWTATVSWTGNDGMLKSYAWKFYLVQ